MISPVAVALAERRRPVRDLTLRTPTLDDVFLELTGATSSDQHGGGPIMTALRTIARPDAGEPTRARPAGFLHDLFSIAGRALRAVPRDLGGGHPARVHRSVLLHREHRHPAEASRRSHPGLNYTAFEMATAILLGVTGVSRAPALVLDVQTHYFDRLLLTPVRRSAILLGHMVADVAVAAALTVPILILGAVLGVRFEGGPLGVVGVHAARRAVELGIFRLRLRHRAEDGQSGRSELQLPAVLPVPVPDLRPMSRAASSRAG